MDIEKLHGESSRLSNAVVQARVSRFSTVSCNYWVLPSFLEQLALLEVWRQIVRNDKLAFDEALSACMCAFLRSEEIFRPHQRYTYRCSSADACYTGLSV